LDTAPGREHALAIPELLENSIEGQLKRFQQLLFLPLFAVLMTEEWCIEDVIFERTNGDRSEGDMKARGEDLLFSFNQGCWETWLLRALHVEKKV
jgi:hypothetical protein